MGKLRSVITTLNAMVHLAGYLSFGRRMRRPCAIVAAVPGAGTLYHILAAADEGHPGRAAHGASERSVTPPPWSGESACAARFGTVLE